MKDFQQKRSTRPLTINRIEADDMIEIDDDKKMAGYSPLVRRNSVPDADHCVNRSDLNTNWAHFFQTTVNNRA